MNENLLYKQRIFQYFKDSRFSSPLSHFTHQASLRGKACSDQCELYAEVKAGSIEKLHFVVKGCILAEACANMLAEFAQQQPVSILKQLDQEQFLSQVVGLPIDSSRLECATLAFWLCKNQL